MTPAAVIATIERGASLPQVLATASHRAGGPLHTGGPGDQHQHGTTPDGEAVNSLHLSTSSIFLGHGGDAPLRFEGLKQPEQSAPLTVPAHLRLDAAAQHRTPCGVYGGLWVWQAESFIAKIPDRFPPPEDGEPLPPRTEPREPGDTVISGADGWIAGGGVPPQIAPEQQVRQLAGTPMELAAPALVFRPQNFSTAAIDLRNLPPAMFDEKASMQWSRAPAVLRLEAAGHDDRAGVEPHHRARPRALRRRWNGSGTLWAMAPELGLELRDVDGLTTSSSELGLWGVDLTIAAPSATDSATAVNGYRIKNVSTAFSQRLQIDSLDSSGADNHRIEIQGPNVITTGGMFQGDSIRLDDGSYYLTLEPDPGALTANRLAYLRDRTFYVGEHLVTNAISASGRIVTLRSYAVDCSGGAIALELPAATSANEGDELEVIDSSGERSDEQHHHQPCWFGHDPRLDFLCHRVRLWRCAASLWQLNVARCGRGHHVSAEELMQLGPLAVVLIVLAREAIGAWKWREERRSKSEAERHADEVRELVTTVRVEITAARERLAAMVEASAERRTTAEELWRRMYQDLAARVAEETEERAERMARITTASAEALEAATVVIESALERLGDDDDT